MVMELELQSQLLLQSLIQQQVTRHMEYGYLKRLSLVLEEPAHFQQLLHYQALVYHMLLLLDLYGMVKPVLKIQCLIYIRPAIIAVVWEFQELLL